MTTRRGRRALVALGTAAVALIVVELALGALSFGQPRLGDPCTSKSSRTGTGIDGAVQRFARSTLDGAACDLHTTREELVLSFVPAAGEKRIRWDRRTIDRALRAGLTRAARDLAGNGVTGQIVGFALGGVLVPSVDWFLEHGG
ncbi:MAG TPA: hypothetical protein VG325_02360 [Solirubrobacteraceae bacterium]|jgi:hypothetical protein|nr:hypothetical protein [Solirubrobacteraceae bacterium]